MARQRWMVAIGLYGSALAVLTMAFLIADANGIPFDRLTSDAAIAYTDEAPFYSGYLSNFGMLFWTTAAALSFFTAATLAPTTHARREMRKFLATFGLLTAVLLIDDMFMIHEAIYRLTGKSQKRVVLLQGLLMLWMLWRFRATMARRHQELLATALLMFGGSLAVDLDFVVMPAGIHHVAEDGFKLMGLFGWCGYAVRCNLDALRLPLNETEAETAAVAVTTDDAPRALTRPALLAENTSPAAPHSPLRCTPSRPPARVS